MKIFNYKEFQKKYSKQHWNRLKNRKTYDFWTLSSLLRMFGYSFCIEGTIIHNKTKHKYDLIKMERKYSDDSLINKELSYNKLKFLLSYVMPKVEVRFITRQYKYAPEIKSNFLAIRTI